MHIYLFINKTNNKMYVGQSKNDPDVRFHQHHKNSCSKNRDRQAITLALYKYGWDGFTRHVLEVCDGFTQNQLNEAECYWIAHYNCISPNGYNLTTGGGANGTVSEETRLKISKSHTGKRGRVTSDETKKLISEAGLGRVMSEDAVRKSAEGRTGGRRSDESKKKMSDAVKNRPAISDETRAKNAEVAVRVHTGRKRSEESKQKMRESSRLRWDREKGTSPLPSIPSHAASSASSSSDENNIPLAFINRSDSGLGT